MTPGNYERDKQNMTIRQLKADLVREYAKTVQKEMVKFIHKISEVIKKRLAIHWSAVKSD